MVWQCNYGTPQLQLTQLATYTYRPRMFYLQVSNQVQSYVQCAYLKHSYTSTMQAQPYQHEST